MDLDDDELEATKKLNGIDTKEEYILKVFSTDGKDMELYGSKKQIEQVVDIIKNYTFKNYTFVELKTANQRRALLNINNITSCEIIPRRGLNDEQNKCKD